MSGGGQKDQGETRLLSAFRYRVARFVVRVVSGPEPLPGPVESAGTEVTIGTDERCTLRLGDPTVSRLHCSITASPEGIQLTDLGSTNGSVIAGCRVATAWLAPGTRVVLGNTEIVVDRSGDDVTEPISRDERFGPVLGTSVAMRRLFALLPKIAASQATVLIEGETGTGKSLLARAIHAASPRADRPFVVVDCGSIPGTLIEGELFGHDRGAFTGAVGERAGYFEAADGGTVFLDEVGELPAELQPKLLRVLEERVIRRLGARDVTHVDVRIIAATNRDLRTEVNRSNFRADLWYRLATVKLRVPPLRERPEDIPRLVEHIWSSLGDTDEPPPRALVERMTRQSWPGNVRELRSAVERALLFDGDPELWRTVTGTGDPIAGGEASDAGLSFRAAKARAIEAWERDFLGDLIHRHGGNISRAARAAGMNRNHLRDLLVRHDIHASKS